MAVNNNAMVIGVLRDHTLAEQAVDELQRNGWSADQIKVFGRHHGGILGNLFGERDTSDELAQLDLSEEQREIYQRELDDGYSIVAVQSGKRQLEARDILHRYGAYHVLTPFELGGERIVPIRREEVNIQKQVVQVGEIRIHKRIITEEKTFTVPVTREEVTIERIPRNTITRPFLSGNIHDQDIANERNTETYQVNPTTNVQEETLPEEMLKEGGALRILVHEEQVVIDKRPVVVEEILIHKQTVQETKQLVEPVKHEEVRIEQIGKVPLHESGEIVRDRSAVRDSADQSL